MTEASPDESSTESLDKATQFHQLRSTVEREFEVDEGFLEYGIPTFFVKLRPNSKTAFLSLLKHLDPLDFIAVLRKREEKTVLQVIPKPPVKPSRTIINIVLFFATLCSVLIAGYVQSGTLIETVTFAAAILAFLGSHEMGHKLLADKHHVEASYPYFIPGIPPIGTFGAVIQQKSLPPNRDALFDIGSTGPIMGLLVAIVVTIIGFPLSTYTWIPPDSVTIPAPILYTLIGELFQPLGSLPPAPPGNFIPVITLHPIAFAGWVGMLVTMLNLVPAGMLDGGHATRTFLGERARSILSYLVIAFLIILGPMFYPMAMIAFFFSMQRHPGALDDVSGVSTRRKLTAILLIVIFVVCVPIL